MLHYNLSSISNYIIISFTLNFTLHYEIISFMINMINFAIMIYIKRSFLLQFPLLYVIT